MRIAICEDEQKAVDALVGALNRYVSKNNLTTTIDTFREGFSYQPGTYDLIFLDVEMPGQNGIEIAKQIRIKDQYVPIVFVTSFEEYAVEGYSVAASGYVVKPVRQKDLDETLSRVLRGLYRRKAIKTVQKKGGGSCSVALGDILYFEVQDHYISIHLRNKDTTIDFWGKMDEETAVLEQYGFVRIHRGYLVNLAHIFMVENNSVFFEDGLSLPVTRAYKEYLQKAIRKYRREAE